MYYVYVIKSSEGRLYIGYTGDLERRLAEHNEGKTRSTKGRSWKLIYYEAFVHRADALKREKALKHGGQAKRHLKGRIGGSIEAV